MLLRSFFDPKLAQVSYLVACQTTREAIIVDPGRNIELYLDAAAEEGVYIIAATETHIHADFVSGCRALAERVGATLYLSGEGGADWQYQYLTDCPVCLLRDGDRWPIGQITFEALHTPGHTPEHLALLVTDCAALPEPIGVFSGDFVFVGDVGRPDLLELAAGVEGAKEQGAQALFQSLQRFKQQPDYLQIWPAHRAGSACGKALGAVPASTVGYERRANWAFQIEDEAEFVAAVLADQPEPPPYFARLKRINKAGAAAAEAEVALPHLTVETLETLRRAGAPLMDTRSHLRFAQAHVPGTFNNPFAARSFVTYAGCFLDDETPFYLIIDPAQLGEAMTDLRRIGLDNIAGFFTPQQVALWADQPGHRPGVIPQVTVAEVAADVKAGRVVVIDVRGAAEFAAGHLPGARNIALVNLLDHLPEIPVDQPLLLQCLSGFRSSIAASLLASRGRTNMMNLAGGYQAWCRSPLLNDEGALSLPDQAQDLAASRAA